MAVPAKIEAVRMGDKLKDLLTFQEKATARLCFVNQRSKHLELRVRQTAALTNFTVVGVIWD
jgi:hypothetical protein